MNAMPRANFYLIEYRVVLRHEEDETSSASSRGDCLHATTTGKVYRYQGQTLPTEQQKSQISRTKSSIVS